MNEKWTAEAVGKMHLLKISGIELANEMGVTNEYISMVLNGHRSPSGIADRIFAAIARIEEKRKDSTNE